MKFYVTGQLSGKSYCHLMMGKCDCENGGETTHTDTNMYALFPPPYRIAIVGFEKFATTSISSYIAGIRL
jgi:hypothetical protein